MLRWQKVHNSWNSTTYKFCSLQLKIRLFFPFFFFFLFYLKKHHYNWKQSCLVKNAHPYDSKEMTYLGTYFTNDGNSLNRIQSSQSLSPKKNGITSCTHFIIREERSGSFHIKDVLKSKQRKGDLKNNIYSLQSSQENPIISNNIFSTIRKLERGTSEIKRIPTSSRKKNQQLISLQISDIPSNTAFATSVASARVGLRLSVILSTTRVITAGFPAILHL